VSVFIPAACIPSCINKDNTGVLVSCYPTHFPFRINKVFLTKNHCFCGVLKGCEYTLFVVSVPCEWSICQNVFKLFNWKEFSVHFFFRSGPA
jgi:hypothetical protein